MTVERTLAIIKPEAVARNIIGSICTMIEQESLCIIAGRMMRMRAEQARQFYAVHSKRDFFPDLVEYMISGPVFAMVLEGDGAVARYRVLMGATHPQDAAPGTIRRLYSVCAPGSKVLPNVVHGSDSTATAEQEIGLFFSPGELCPRS